MEAGSIIANHFNERTNKEIFPGVTKFGALVGDGCKIGANAVLSPGTILEKNSVVARAELINQNDMSKKHDRFNWRDLFINKGFDLVMVVLGVTIAFQLNNWKLNSDARSLERFYIESLLADVNTDIEEIKTNVAVLKSDREAVEGYLAVMDKLPADSLLRPLIAIMSFETFTPSDNTYNTMVAGTGLSALSKHTLVERITDYYSSYISIRRFEDVYTKAIFDVHNHFSEYVIYDQGKVIDKSVVAMPRSRNSLIVALAQLNTGVEDYGDALDRALALKSALEGSL
jgi:hypothetical protein